MITAIRRDYKVMASEEEKIQRIDPWTTVVPFAVILSVCVIFIAWPDSSTRMLSSIRFFLGDTFGS